MRCIITIFFLLFLVMAFASNNTVIKGDTIKEENETTLIQVVKTSENEAKIDAEKYYRMMYENAKKENSQLISLLTTSLTVIIAVIIGIIGSSFFYNYRFNKKEYELYTKETVNKIDVAQKEVIKEAKEKIQILQEANTKKISEEFTQISNTYKTNFETVKESFNSIISNFKQDIDKSITNHDKSIESLENSIEELENTASEDLKLNKKHLRIDILDIKGQLYFMKEWYSLALSNFVDQANLCVDADKSWQLDYIINDINRSVNKAIETKKTITPATKINIEKLLSSIPPYLSDKKKKLEKNYKKIEVKEVKLPNRTPLSHDYIV